MLRLLVDVYSTVRVVHTVAFILCNIYNIRNIH